MDRTVPKTGSEEIELYMRTYYSLLRSTHTIQIETLVEAHKAMDSSLHVGARMAGPDVSALAYTSQRLPDVMPRVTMVLLGQVEKLFIDAGFPVRDWERVSAPGRRRRMHFDGRDTLAVFIASRSDIDDLIPMLTAYQIEWNKLHMLLRSETARHFLAQNGERATPLSDAERVMLASALQMDEEDLRRLELVWGANFVPTLALVAAERKQFGLRQIAGSLADYRRGTTYWWDDVSDFLQHHTDPVVDLRDRPVYFVSSNTHSLINLLSGFAMREEDAIVRFIEARGHESLLAEYRVLSEKGDKHRANFLYYALRDYLRRGDPGARARRLQEERELGISRITSQHGSDLETQVIDLARLRPDRLDPRLAPLFDPLLAHSDAVIFNVDYPLGLAAYELLNRVTENVERLLGVYVMGKAATLNGRVGDVMVANIVHDEHSSNTYLFSNCFTGEDVAPYMTYGMVLDNQKAISAPGTFLQNPRYMDVFYREGYTIIEMEAGPYLSAIYEAVRPKRHPQNEIVTLMSSPFDLGFLHYASDTPFRRGHNLGAGSLEYRGIAPTYATAIAIIQRIFRREASRLRAEGRFESTPVGEVMLP
ncbi:MAG TPA: hypothetical protein VER79_00640 [Candidatus Limnocylindrales bacterium]|nr:hypothetical protein [Candidatus Limnocylindrales bacterium]